jgi:hypothetical protein
MVGRGLDPEVFTGANTSEGDERDAALLARYRPHIRALLSHGSVGASAILGLFDFERRGCDSQPASSRRITGPAPGWPL